MEKGLIENAGNIKAIYMPLKDIPVTDESKEKLKEQFIQNLKETQDQSK